MNLRLNSISVSLSNKLILDKIQLEINQGELVALLGPSGCGKSTLLKTIAGLITPESGDILMNKQSVIDVQSNNRGAVIVFQDLRLFPHMTIEENIAFPLKIKGMPKQERLEKAQKLLKSVQLEGYHQRRLTEMSGGQLQRAALARALAADPKILLLDEPFSSLDNGLRQDMRLLVLQLHAEYNMTTILVTHDQQEAFMMSDRVAVMMNGQIIQYDTPRKIYHSPVSKAVADYLGGGNYIKGHVVNGHFISESIRFSAEAEDGLYLALFRPQALTILPDGDYRITDIHYWGERWDITVRGPDQQLVLAVTSEHPWQVGDYIGISFDLSNAVLIKEDAGTGKTLRTYLHIKAAAS